VSANGRGNLAEAVKNLFGFTDFHCSDSFGNFVAFYHVMTKAVFLETSPVGSSVFITSFFLGLC
jgi:hypothetical protein